MNNLKRAPKGKYRVCRLWFNYTSFNEKVVGDYTKKEFAIALTDLKNLLFLARTFNKRGHECSGGYFLYDDQGHALRGISEVRGKRLKFTEQVRRFCSCLKEIYLSSTVA